MKTSKWNVVKTAAGRNGRVVLMLALGAMSLAISGTASAHYFSPQFTEQQRAYNLRHYYLYPYHYSYGPRYDPYWSYNSSYFPETYYGDGSSYGLGYSGYSGNGWYGSYYYY